jgi:hypothetical protein
MPAFERIVEEVNRLHFAPVQRKRAHSIVLDAESAVNVAKAGVANGSSPLPYTNEIQKAFGRHDVSTTKAQIGGNAATASEAIGAKAYAYGDRVAFASSPDLHTAAHEAAHVVQQRSGRAPSAGLDTPGDPFEQNAEEVAEAVAAGTSAEAVLDSIVILPGAAATAVQRERETEKQRVGPTDPEYVNQHRSHILAAIADRIARIGLPHPHPRVYWAHGENANPVGSAIWQYVDAVPDMALKRLMMLSYPAELFEIVDATRRGPEGTRLEAVSLAVAIAFDAPLLTSIRRMGARFCVQLDLHGGIAPQSSDLVASSPLDGVIAEVLVKPGSIHYSPPKKRAPDDTGGRPFAKGTRNVQYEWLGSKDQALWNWIKVTAPPNPTVEDVAQTPFVGDQVLGGSEQAYRIAASPPYFGIPFETARLVPDAISHAPFDLQVKLQTGPGPRVADPTKLGRSIVADEAVLAQAPAASSSDPPLAQSVDRARVQIGFMLRTLDELKSAFFLSQQKAFTTRLSEAVKEEEITSEFVAQAATAFGHELSSWHLSDHLGGVIGFLNRRNHDLSLGKKLDSRWVPVVAEQERFLHAA